MNDQHTETDVLAEATKALEDAFVAQTGSLPQTSTTNTTGSNLQDKIKALQAMEEKIRGKAVSLQADVRAKLESLKSLKGAIEQMLTTIKSLEASEQAITAEIAKIKELETKQASLEGEIKELEQNAQKNLG
ncbi:MAG: hypothetical protein WCO58_01895 [bacterium]